MDEPRQLYCIHYGLGIIFQACQRLGSQQIKGKALHTIQFRMDSTTRTSPIFTPSKFFQEIPRIPQTGFS